MRKLTRSLWMCLLALALPLQAWATAYACVAQLSHSTLVAYGHAADHSGHMAGAAGTAEAAHGAQPHGSGQPDASEPAEPAAKANACNHCASSCVGMALLPVLAGLWPAADAAAPWARWQPTLHVGFLTDGPERPPRTQRV